MRLSNTFRGLAIAGAITMAVGGGVVYEATIAPPETIQSAEAHAGNAETEVTCDQPNSQYKATGDVEWTNVPNGVTGTVYIRVGTSSFQNWTDFGSFNDWTVLGVTTGASGSLEYNYTLPGTTTSAPWYYIWIDWSDGYNQQRKFDDRAEGLAGDCVTVTTPDAKFDVGIEPATCTVGEKLNDPTGTFVDFDATNTPAGTVGPANYSIKGDAQSTHTFNDGTLTKTVSGTLAGPLDPKDHPECRTEVTPVTPTVVQPKCVAGQPVPGSAPTFAELVALQPAGVVATLNAGSTTDGTFTADSSHYLAAGSATTFSLKLDPTPSAASCAPPCTQHCTPPQPFTGDEVHANWFQAQLNAALPWFIGGLISVGLVLLVVFWRPLTAAVRKLRRPRVTG